MDKLRRWLVDLGNDEITLICSDTADYEERGFKDQYVTEIGASEPPCPVYEVRHRSIEDYVKEVHKRDNEMRKVVPDRVCQERYEMWLNEFMEEKEWEMAERKQQYIEERDKAVFGESMEYLRMKQQKTVRSLMECCCVEESHLKIKESSDTMEGYRLELGLGEDDRESEVLRKYAFFRRFFSYNNWRYSLTDVQKAARHLYLNVGENDRERIMNWFSEYSMLLYIQMDMDVLSASDGYRLMEIKEFDPFAVLELVDAIGDYARDRETVRGKWVELMLRSGDIVRRFGRKEKECFIKTRKNEPFSRRFVLATVGVMMKNGWYKGTIEQLAIEISKGDREVKTVYRYIDGLYEDLHILPASSKLVQRIVGIKEN